MVLKSAQRLLASKVWAVHHLQIYDIQLLVLNAYWHQRFGQISYLYLIVTIHRAQRLLASKVWAGDSHPSTLQLF